MKKLILFIFTLTFFNAVFAQFPCVIDYKINNGGGNCPDTIINGVVFTATGSVTLTFEGAVQPNNIPIIASVVDITNPGSPVLVTGITFGFGTLLNNGKVRYCYYIGPNNNNNLQGNNSEFSFNILYNNGQPCGSQIPLPVSMQTFTANRYNNSVVLKWTTLSEMNNLGFEIQRLVGPGSWNSISFIPTQATGGTTTSSLNYSFTDMNNMNGIVQYRLMQTDLDRRTRYSEIRSVRGANQTGKTIVFPNPSTDGNLQVIFEKGTAAKNVSISDMSGRVLKQFKSIEADNIRIENLGKGLYMLNILTPSTGERTTQKIVVY